MSKVDFKFEGSKLILNVDPNEDGEPLVKIEVDIAEIPDEVIAALKK